MAEPTARLRARAEEFLRRSPVAIMEMAPEEIRGLVHELQVHQVELDLQNEELRRLQLELTAARDRYGRLYEFAPIGLIALDDDAVIRRANLTALRIFGRDRARVVDRRLVELIAMPQRDEFHVWWRKALGERATTHGEFQLARPAGPPLFACLDVVFHFDEGTASAEVALSDVTPRVLEQAERARLESGLRDAQKLESIGVLASGIAHDFNNLLGVVLGHASLALDMLEQDAPIRPLLREIEKATARAAALTDQLLTYSGRRTGTVATIDLSTVVTDMAQLLGAGISKQVRLVQELAPEPLAVAADASQLRQVVMNLIINASDAIGAGSGTITIRTRRVAGPETSGLAGSHGSDGTHGSHGSHGSHQSHGSHVCVEVEDDGPGMDEETRRRCLEPFFTTKFTGRGLGLSTLSGIVRAHGGTVEIQSAPGRGSTFRVILPASSEPIAPPPAAAPTIVAPVVAATDGGRPHTVLVVDDEEMIRTFVHMALAREGFQCVLAVNGADAVVLHARHRAEISAILLDLTLTDMGGDEVLAAIRAVDPAVPVILASGYAMPHVLARIPDAESLPFLRKPFATGPLVAAVHAAIAHAGERDGGQ